MTSTESFGGQGCTGVSTEAGIGHPGPTAASNRAQHDDVTWKSHVLFYHRVCPEVASSYFLWGQLRVGFPRQPGGWEMPCKIRGFPTPGGGLATLETGNRVFFSRSDKQS